MTKNPFAVNLTLLPALQPPDYPAYARIIIEEGIRIVETAGNSPGPVIKMLKEAQCTILHKCTTIRHAQSAVNLGVDFLSIDGFECAGHVGESDITNFILLSRARQSLGVPFIASGGFADGQGLAAALSLGAEGINMGTRFMCTVEAPIHVNIKEAIVQAQETDTELVLRRWRNTSRLFANKVAKEAVKAERESTSGNFEDVAPFVSGKRGRQVFLNGDKDFGVSQIMPHLVPDGMLTSCIGLDRRPSDWTDTRYSHLRRADQTHRARGCGDAEQDNFADRKRFRPACVRLEW
jgi:NADH:quinone reductase (non-electrogenic)